MTGLVSQSLLDLIDKMQVRPSSLSSSLLEATLIGPRPGRSPLDDLVFKPYIHPPDTLTGRIRGATDVARAVAGVAAKKQLVAGLAAQVKEIADRKAEAAELIAEQEHYEQAGWASW